MAAKKKKKAAKKKNKRARPLSLSWEDARARDQGKRARRLSVAGEALRKTQRSANWNYREDLGSPRNRERALAEGRGYTTGRTLYGTRGDPTLWSQAPQWLMLTDAPTKPKKSSSTKRKKSSSSSTKVKQRSRAQSGGSSTKVKWSGDN